MALERVLLKKLKIILKSNFFYIILIFFIIIYIILHVHIFKRESNYDINDNKFKCVIENYFIEDDILKLELSCKDKLIGYYYFKDSNEKINFLKNYNIGNIININGKLEVIDSFNNYNIFNYSHFQYFNNIFYNIKITSFDLLGNSSSVIYKLKNIILNRINNLKCFPYINGFLLGNKEYISDNVIKSFQINGILHLFAVSGMHLSILVSFINKIIKKDNYIKFFLFMFVFLFFFLLIKSVSLLRAILFCFMNFINKKIKLDLNKYQIILLVFSFLIFYNPWYIFSISFWYSIVVGSGLFLFSDEINKKKGYLKKLLLISSFSFLFSFPITIYNFFEINLVSIIANLFFVPFVSFVLYPFCIIALFFPWLDNILYMIILLFENFSLYFSNFQFNLILMKPPLVILLLYYVVIFLSFKKKIMFFLFFIIVFVHIYFNQLFYNEYLYFFDVGQGDSTFIHYSNYNILIDTGGIANYSVSEDITIPLLKSLGIYKIDFLLITHGDFDHMGEAINLVENFKVEKVIFNCGEFNELEQDLIKVLDKKKIPYYSYIKELNIDDNKLYFLNNKYYGNENDNSSVIYTEFNNHKFLFMGDAGVEVEQDLIEKYNLQDIDVLKVGHHGSKTSSGKEFIDEINPKYSIISVGKNNRYGHPNKEVLNILDESKIYRTDQGGSIIFKIKNNKLQIYTCPP